MKYTIDPDPVSSGYRAAMAAAAAVREAISARGEANIVVGTGASQFAVLDAFIVEPDIRWDRVTVFHLDEYIGLPIHHPASFRKYLWERFQAKLPLPLKAFHYLDGEIDAAAEAKRVGDLIARHPIDMLFGGIGENGHLAFNDPPADFDTEEPYLVVDLDEACRQQQFGEGWFDTFDDVPKQAISMSVKQVMKAKTLIVTVPDERKAKAVKACLEGPVSNMAPASILQQHDQCQIYLDEAAASLLDAKTKAAAS